MGVAQAVQTGVDDSCFPNAPHDQLRDQIRLQVGPVVTAKMSRAWPVVVRVSTRLSLV